MTDLSLSVLACLGPRTIPFSEMTWLHTPERGFSGPNFAKLPKEMWVTIFDLGWNFENPFDRRRVLDLRLVCKKLAKLLASDYFWGGKFYVRNLFVYSDGILMPARSELTRWEYKVSLWKKFAFLRAARRNGHEKVTENFFLFITRAGRRVQLSNLSGKIQCRRSGIAKLLDDQRSLRKRTARHEIPRAEARALMIPMKRKVEDLEERRDRLEKKRDDIKKMRLQ